jgi:hypothetical protein
MSICRVFKGAEKVGVGVMARMVATRARQLIVWTILSWELGVGVGIDRPDDLGYP